MYFPDDPLIAIDPIACAVPERHRGRLIADFDIGLTEAGLGARLPLRHRAAGPDATPLEVEA